jgi:CTP:molybdopterin cytidylyltransferase MocA
MISAVLLAAGESTRMGRPKALLPWGDASQSDAPTLLEFQIGELRAAGVDDIVVVLGHEAAAIRAHVPNTARVVVNEAYREGRASSLRAGANALPDGADPIVVLNVDQPRPSKVHERLLAAHAGGGALVTLPVCDGRRGHPAVVSGKLLPELRAATEVELGLHGVIERHTAEVREVPFILLQHESMASEPDFTAMMVLLDINTPEDYENALALFGIHSTRPPAP